jgi:2-methyl-3-hydroxypyridine 5-carboxylic acid dioxygenase
MTLEAHASVTEGLVAWEQQMRPLTDRCQARSAELAATRGMSLGSRFDEAHSETMRYDPVTQTQTETGRVACLA